jgi:hypothetical protein
MVLGIAAFCLGIGGRRSSTNELIAAVIICWALMFIWQIWGAVGFILCFLFGALLRRQAGAQS